MIDLGGQVGSIVTEESGWNGPEEWMDKKEARRQGRYTQCETPPYISRPFL